MESKSPSRQRCCECRLWFSPEASASRTQKTCSAECRLRRRAKHEQQRRATDLVGARESERDRQRRHRERVREGSFGGASLPMSRAGLPAQAADKIEQIVEKLGQAQRVSLAGLRRELRRFSLEKPELAEQKTGT